MSSTNLFKKKVKKNENTDYKYLRQDFKNKQNDNQFTPITIIRKPSNKKKLTNENSEQKNENNIAAQDIQNRNASKKAKKPVIQSPQKNKNVNQNQSNNKKDNDKSKNENDGYTDQVVKKLRDSSLKKSNFTNKKEKKNDFLKVSINITGDPEFDLISKDSEQFTKEKNTINNLFNPITYIKNENNTNNINNIFSPTNININIRKSHNTNIIKFSEDKINKNKNEPYKIKEKLQEQDKINQENQGKSSSKNNNILQNIDKNSEETNTTQKRSSKKKNTYTSQNVIFRDDKQISQFNLEKKKSMRNSTKESSSLKGSLKDSLRKSNTFGRKSINNSINTIIIPLLNRKKENNCFLNVIIQVFFQLSEFKKELLETNDNLATHSKTIKEFYNLLRSYANEQIKYKDNKNQIEPTLSVNDLRNYLNNIFKCYRPGETGDPMETIGYILDIIHKIYCKKRKDNPKKIENCKCPSHLYFYLKLVDIITCPHCNSRKVQMYDKDCFMFNILTKDITSKLYAKNYNSFKLKLFTKLKEYNEIYENENKIKIPGCNCNETLMLSYEKKLKLNGPSSPYLILNITWGEEFPSMIEILTVYGLIPISESIENLFTFAEDIKPKINDIYYIKSIILYGLYHYVCILYLKEQRKWAVIDDKTIKYITKYYDLIDFLLRNHLMPVGIIYSKDRNDEINDYEIKLHVLNKDEYLKLYQFCKDVDTRRGLKVSDITTKGSFNDNNENYLNNNYFYKSVIDFLGPNKDNNKQDLINNVSGKKNEKMMNPKTSIPQNNIFNKDKNNSNKNIKNKDNNKDNNIEQNQINKKHDSSKGRKVMGDFSDNNMKGGILILSNSMSDNTGGGEKTGQTKEESDLLDFGKNYVGDDDN